MTCFRPMLLASILLASCGGVTRASAAGSPADGGGDAPAAPDAPTVPDAAVPPDAAVSHSCQTLVLTFVGCDEERLKECEREYNAVSASNRALVDASAACLRKSFPGVKSLAWPAPGATCTPAAVPPVLASWDQWFHGTCQGDNGNAVYGLLADPGFPPCGADAGQPQCFFGDPATATL